MKKAKRALLLGLMVVVLAAVTAAPASAGDQVERPYESRSTSTLVVDPPEECDLSQFPTVTCDLEVTSTGNATHLGKTTGFAEGVVVLDFSTVCVGRGGAPGNPLTAITDGVIVAANGSEIWTHAEGTTCFVDFGLGFDMVGTQEIVGGTGRFEGATGSATTSFSSDAGSVNTIVGTITY